MKIVKNIHNDENKYALIGQRIKSERVKCGLTKNQFAEKGGVKLRAQFTYESAERSPDARYLQGIAEAGADVQYIITGQRRENIEEAIKIYGDIFQILDETLQAKSLNLPSQRKRDAADVIYKEYCANGTNIESMVNVLAKTA